MTAGYLVTGRVEAVPSLGHTQLSLDVQQRTVGVHVAGRDPVVPSSAGAGLEVGQRVLPPARAEICNRRLYRRGGEMCGAAAIVAETRICVHEHVRNAMLCVAHAGTPSVCHACRTAPSRAHHDCRLTIVDSAWLS